MADARVPSIYVLAGTNGAGKSSLAGAMFRQSGVDYFNPDDAAHRILTSRPGITQEEANSLAWHEGKRLLEEAIAEQSDFAFETTLGGQTITRLLEDALSKRMDVRVWYAGLNGADRHIKRVRARVARGGHAIPETTIRERYNSSRLNLIRLMPKLAELRVFDNSVEADPHKGVAPRPKLILHLARRTVVYVCDLVETPEWAKPIVAAAIRISR